MKTFYNKFFFFWALLILSHLLLPIRVGAEGLADVKIWNPTKVDWWVSMDDSVLNGKQACEIHWLYDDNLDVVLTMSEDDKLFFAFMVNPKNKDIKPSLAIKKGVAQKASLSIDEVKHPLGVTDVNLPSGTAVIMGVPSVLNDIYYVQGASRLLLNIDNTIYNFPLENMDENVAYFKKCLQTLGHEPASREGVKSDVVEAVKEAEDSVGEPYDTAVVSEPLLGVSMLFSDAPSDVPSDVSPDVSPASSVEETQPDPALEVKQVSKQKDNMLADTQYVGMKDKGDKSQSEDSRTECKGDVYDEQGTAIIHNLMRKLKILENEKEELRAKLVSTSASGAIPDILDCGAQALEEVDQSINDDIVARFEVTIDSLRSENELLREALDSVEDTGEKDDDIAQLEKQLSDLVKQNHKLQNELFNYELESKSSDEAVSGGRPDVIDDLIKDNDLTDIIPKNPETMSDGLPVVLENIEATPKDLPVISENLEVQPDDRPVVREHLENSVEISLPVE